MTRARLEELVGRKHLIQRNLSEKTVEYLRYVLRCHDAAWGYEPEPLHLQTGDMDPLHFQWDNYSYMSRTRLKDLVVRKQLTQRNVSDLDDNYMRYILRCHDEAWKYEPESVLAATPPHLQSEPPALVVSTHSDNNFQPFT